MLVGIRCKVNRTDEQKWGINSSQTGELKFYKAIGFGSSSYKMTIQDTGNVGIGTTSPETLLHLHKDTTGDVPLPYWVAKMMEIK